MLPVIPLECMAGTTGLEPATSAVTAHGKVVTNRKQASRMAPFGAQRHGWEPLMCPYCTHVLCPNDLCRNGNDFCSARPIFEFFVRNLLVPE